MIPFILLPFLTALGLLAWSGGRIIRQIRARQVLRVRDLLFLAAALLVCAFTVSGLLLVLSGLGHSACAGAQAEFTCLLVFVIGLVCPLVALFLYRYYQTLMLAGGRGGEQSDENSIHRDTLTARIHGEPVPDEKPDLSKLHDAAIVSVLVITVIVVLLLGKLSFWPPLMFALRNGYTAMAETLIDAGLFVNDIDICGHTPLPYAAMTGKNTLVKRMVERGADINASDKHNLTALNQAIVHRNTDLALYLIEHGANVNSAPGNFFVPLAMAAEVGDVDLCKLLIAKGADVNATGPHGSALSSAARHNRLEVARLLLDHGAQTEGKAPTDWTPLMHASYEGHADMVKLLLERGADPFAKTYAQETPSSLAKIRGHAEVMEILKAAERSAPAR